MIKSYFLNTPNKYIHVKIVKIQHKKNGSMGTLQWRRQTV